MDGKWSSWVSWGACGVSCGGGTRQRTRLCASPAPQHGGRQCEGNDVHIDFCNSDPCPGGPDLCALIVCPSHLFHLRVKCRCKCKTNVTFFSSVSGNWGPWSNWGSCSKTCNGGQMRRYRTCDNPRPANGGRACAGGDTQIQRCSTANCPGEPACLRESPCS